MRHLRFLVVLVLLATVLAACGGDDDDETSTATSGEQGAATATSAPPTEPATPTAEPEAAGCEIAFAGDPASVRAGYRIYCVNADGSDLRPLTDKPSNEFFGDPYEAFPAWSPDGAQLAFTRHGPDAGVYVVSADGSDEQRIAEGWAIDIAWSPDGSRLALSWVEDGWSERMDDSVPELVVVDVDGANLQVISDHPELVSDGVEFRPAWSPDGTQLLFQRVPAECPAECLPAIFIISADGSDLEEVDTGDIELFYGSPDITWAPDGESIGVHGLAPGDDAPGVFRITLDGGEPERLTPEDQPLFAGLFSWSPDGSQIAYGVIPMDTSQATGPPMELDLYIVDVESGEARRVTETPDVLEASPFWSPDGERLLYLASPAEEESGHLQSLQIGVVNVDGSNPTIVLDDFSMREELSSSPLWRPTGD